MVFKKDFVKLKKNTNTHNSQRHYKAKIGKNY